VHICWETDTT